MGSLTVYALEAAFCLNLLLAPYVLLLRRETFFRFNRFALLGILALSFALPLCKSALPATEQPAAVQDVLVLLQTVEAAGNLPPTAESSRAWLPVLAYAAGLAISLAVLAVQYARMRRFIRKGCLWTEKLKGGITLYCHARDVAPCSWMKSIVISQNDYEAAGREILLHEEAHVRLRHSWDTLFVALCRSVQWFNPALWFLSAEMEEIHEYEADGAVLRQGIDARKYQWMLIQKAIGSHQPVLANNLKKKNLKKRFVMMLQKKSNPRKRAGLLCVLPAAALSLMAMTNADVKSVENELRTADPVAAWAAAPDTLAPKGKESTLKLKGKPLHIMVDAKNKDGKTGKKPLLVVNGKPLSAGETIDSETGAFLSQKADNITSVQVLKGKEATTRYGKAANDGVLLIETREQPGEGQQQVTVTHMTEAPKDDNSVQITVNTTTTRTEQGKTSTTTQTTTTDMNNAVVLIDGKPGKTSDLTPDQIQSITVLKNEEAKKYGAKDNQGVILIKTKKATR